MSPYRPAQICAKATCTRLVPGGRTYCEPHVQEFRQKLGQGTIERVAPKKRAPGSTRGRGRLRPNTEKHIEARDKFVCQICGKAGGEIDHIQPTSEGGSDRPDNLQMICRLCHARKTGEENSRSLRRAVDLFSND